jgi:catechol 2,3-dioxygenase
MMSDNPKARLAHFGFYVRDVARMSDFYSSNLGLIVTDHGEASAERPEMVFLSAEPDEHHQLVLMSGRPDDLGFSTIQQISFLVDTLDQLRVVHKRLVSNKCTIERSITHGNAWSIYFLDPEGNRAEAYCHTPWHVPQPHAHPVDFSLPTEEIERLTEAHCRATEGFMTAAEREKLMSRMMAPES